MGPKRPRPAGLSLLSWVAVSLAAAAGDTAPGGPVEVLNDKTIWRFMAVYRPFEGETVKALDVATRRWVRWGDELEAPLPPADWMKRAFDDTGWPRRRGPFFNIYGGTRRPGLALLCVRGRFGVTDPARAGTLTLSLRYRGGVVVYLNGREAARGHLPDGPIAPLTPAADYAPDVFLDPNGRKTLPTLGRRAPPDDVRDRYEGRIRQLRVTLPPEFLQQGTNILALELHRTNLPAELTGRRRKVNWDTAGLVAATLTANTGGGILPNAGRPEGAQVWNADPMLRVGDDADWGDPFEPLRPIDLLAPINGLASGQVVVSAPTPLDRVSATVSDLKAPDGAVIPASAVRVRYAKPYEDTGFLALADDPPNTGSVRSIWVTVRVPPDARAGTYTGTLTIDGLGAPKTVPVALTVYGWTVGDPSDWRTVVNLLQSPESVAGYYKVPLWSDRHFDLMAGTMRLMGACGNDILGISAVRQNVFGDDPVLVFRREGERLAPELKFAKRYLEMYDRLAGEPQYLVLHVWSYGMYQRGAGRDGGKVEQRRTTIPVTLLEGDRLVPIDMPIYGEPGTEAIWREAMDGLREIVTGLGWRRECILLGTSGDGWPSSTTVAMFQAVAPYARWRAITHGSGVPRWGVSDAERTQPNGMVVAYLELVRRITNRRARVRGHPVCCNSRDCVKSDPFQFRSLPLLNTMSANFDGFCWKGMDYWTYTTAEGTERSALNTYVHFGNIVGSTPRTIAAPGPDGALPTVQYEMLREGIQDAEAMQFLRGVLADDELRGRVGRELAARCETVMEEMLSMFETGARYDPHGGGDVRGHVRRLYAVAADVRQAVGEEELAQVKTGTVDLFRLVLGGTAHHAAGK